MKRPAALWGCMALAALALMACDDARGPRSQPAAADATTPPHPPTDPPPEADAAPPPSAAPSTPLARAAGRMTVEALARSIPVITGGLRWTEDFGGGVETDVLQALAPTLGAPDYLRVTEENLEPSLILAKFLNDAAQRLCVRWVERDEAAAAADRTLVVHPGDWAARDPAAVGTALRELQLRFFGRRVPEGAAGDAVLEPLRALFQDASSTAAPGREARDGWLAVCIAHMTDPELVIY